MAGSDTPNPYAFPSAGLHDELELPVDAGVTPLEALQSATLDPARGRRTRGARSRRRRSTSTGSTEIEADAANAGGYVSSHDPSEVA